MHPETLPGKNQTLINQTQAMPSLILAGVKQLAAGELHVRRYFPAFNLMIVTAGTFQLFEDGHAYTLQRGQWFIQTPDKLHYGLPPQPEEAAFIFIHFMPHGTWELRPDLIGGMELENSGSGMYLPQFCLQIPMNGICTPAIMEQAQDLVAQGTFHSFMHSQARFTQLLQRMMEASTHSEHRPVAIHLVVTYMRQHFLNRDFSLQRVAQHFGYTRQHLTRLLKMHYGQTFSDFIQALRVDYAKRELAIGHTPLSQIAETLGYNDSAAFSHMFKRMTGESPSAYCRRMHRV